MVTTLYAGILGLVYIVLSFYVILGRYKYQANVGDSGSEAMLKRIRVHANFMEYVPLALLLMFLSEYEGASEALIHGLGAALLIGRIVHPFGLTYKFGPSVGRSGGMILTFSVIIISSIYAIQSYFTF